MSESPVPILPVSPACLEEAAALLRAGKLVAFPTETVYGLGADATNREAVASIYTTKGRPSHNPLIVHVNSLKMAKKFGEFTNIAEEFALKYWPGPLTLVVKAISANGVYCHGEKEVATIAIRFPGHVIAQKLITLLGRPIVAPSANRSGKISATTAAHVAEEFAAQPGNLSLIIDGGATEMGIESTVIDCTGVQPVVLREGAFIPDNIQYIVDDNLSSTLSSVSPRSPGMLASHYAPNLPLRLNAAFPTGNEVFLAFGHVVEKVATVTKNLSPSANLEEAAHHLYDYLRQLDLPSHSAIAVMPIPDTGIGRAINDRLRRAAAPRS